MNTNPSILSAIRFAQTLLMSFLVCGCVAVWGNSYKVTTADSTGITIQYDKGLSSSAKMAVLARNHCKQFGKVAEPEDARMPGVLLGIIEESYSCKAA